MDDLWADQPGHVSTLHLKDLDAFERAYTQDHAPMVNTETFPGITRFVASRVVGTPDGSPPPFYRVAELHFPSMESLQRAASSPAAQKAVAHAVAVSNDGRPIFLLSEEEMKAF